MLAGMGVFAGDAGLRGRVPVLALMGSGETSPTMVSVHPGIWSPGCVRFRRCCWARRTGSRRTSRRWRGRRRVSSAVWGCGCRCRCGLRGAAEIGADAQGTHGDVGRAAVRGADWVFAGSGRPTYALEQWRGGPVGEALADHARTGRAARVFASPVYEIYKCGSRPRWVEGLDVLGLVGLRCAVMPHYDNAESGTHDMRSCYLGERRRRILARELPDDAAILGLDEHTAALVDVGRDLVQVRGRGCMTVRRDGESVVVRSGESVSLTELCALVRGEAAGRAARAAGANDRDRTPETPPMSLRDIVVGCEERFEAGLLAG